MNIIKKSELMEFVMEKKEVLLGSAQPAEPTTKPRTKPTTKPNESPSKSPNRGPWRRPDIKPGEEPKPKASYKAKIKNKYPKKYVKEHIKENFPGVEIVNETINNDYSVSIELMGGKKNLINCVQTLKEHKVIS